MSFFYSALHSETENKMSDDSNQAMATPPPPTFQPDNQGVAPAPGPVQQQQGPQGLMPQTGPGPGGNMQGMPGQTAPMGGPTAPPVPIGGPSGPGHGGQGQGYQQGPTGGQPNPGNMEMLHKVCTSTESVHDPNIVVFA